MWKLYTEYCRLNSQDYGIFARDLCEQKEKDHHSLETYDQKQSCFYLYDSENIGKRILVCGYCAITAGIAKCELNDCENHSKKKYISKNILTHEYAIKEVLQVNDFELNARFDSIMIANLSREYGWKYCPACRCQPSENNPLLFFSSIRGQNILVCANCLEISEYQMLYQIYLTKREEMLEKLRKITEINNLPKHEREIYDFEKSAELYNTLTEINTAKKYSVKHCPLCGCEPSEKNPLQFYSSSSRKDIIMCHNCLKDSEYKKLYSLSLDKVENKDS